MPSDLRRPFFFFLPTGSLLGFPTFGLLSLPGPLLLRAQRVGGRLVGALLVLGPRALKVVEVIFPAPTSAGDLARDGLFLVLLFCIRASLNISGLPRSQNTGLPLLSVGLDPSEPLLF